MSKRIAVFVLGMHRSGTSAMTGVLSIMGLDLGGQLIPAASCNEKGFFENQRIVDINNKILEELHTTCFAVLPNNWQGNKKIAFYRQEIAKIIETDFLKSEIFLLKDPRLCLLLPLWQEVMLKLGVECRYVLPIRHPFEVAESLKVRDHFWNEKSAFLWAYYQLAAEFYTRGMVRIVVPYERLLANPKAVIEETGKCLAISFPKEISKSLSEVNDFLDPTMKHYMLSSLKKKGLALSQAVACYRALLLLAKENNDSQGNYVRLDCLRKTNYLLRAYFYLLEGLHSFGLSVRNLIIGSKRWLSKQK
jgi:hypothetical protein